jgi:hypothetical protein
VSRIQWLLICNRDAGLERAVVVGKSGSGNGERCIYFHGFSVRISIQLPRRILRRKFAFVAFHQDIHKLLPLISDADESESEICSSYPKLLSKSRLRKITALLIYRTRILCDPKNPYLMLISLRF